MMMNQNRFPGAVTDRLDDEDPGKGIPEESPEAGWEESEEESEVPEAEDV